jgi:hypothetical protein
MNFLELGGQFLVCKNINGKNEPYPISIGSLESYLKYTKKLTESG